MQSQQRRTIAGIASQPTATEAVGFDFAVDVFRIETLPNVPAVSRELWGNLSERSEFVSPPDWQPTHLGT